MIAYAFGWSLALALAALIAAGAWFGFFFLLTRKARPAWVWVVALVCLIVALYVSGAVAANLGKVFS